MKIEPAAEYRRASSLMHSLNAAGSLQFEIACFGRHALLSEQIYGIAIMAEESVDHIYKYVSPGNIKYIFSDPDIATIKFSMPADFNDPFELF
jgi:hypothetical protein